ncbi:uncharacterized protein LOC135501714 [Lineus longissimus]|uniref:uncharacterized protein LOC135501714 n=1 Tax=Lineus longissimus TaxID=88925 RepID=UPI00315C6B73
MAAIAGADFLVLVNFAVCQSTMFWIVKESLGEIPLQICWYSAYTFGPISGLCLALMSIDRVIAVRFPLRAARLCTTGRAKRAVVISYTAIMTVNLHIFVVYKKDGANLARGGPATQSSIWCGAGPNRAVDGNRNPSHYLGSCSHTDNNVNPWWSVDLGTEVSVRTVIIVNRLTISE